MSSMSLVAVVSLSEWIGFVTASFSPGQKLSCTSRRVGWLHSWGSGLGTAGHSNWHRKLLNSWAPTKVIIWWWWWWCWWCDDVMMITITTIVILQFFFSLDMNPCWIFLSMQRSAIARARNWRFWTGETAGTRVRRGFRNSGGLWPLICWIRWFGNWLGLNILLWNMMKVVDALLPAPWAKEGLLNDFGIETAGSQPTGGSGCSSQALNGLSSLNYFSPSREVFAQTAKKSRRID